MRGLVVRALVVFCVLGGISSAADSLVPLHPSRTLQEEILALPPVQQWQARKLSRRKALKEIRNQIQRLDTELKELLTPGTQNAYRSAAPDEQKIAAVKRDLLLYMTADVFVYHGVRELDQNEAKRKELRQIFSGVVGFLAPIVAAGAISVDLGAVTAALEMLSAAAGGVLLSGDKPNEATKLSNAHQKIIWLLSMPTMTGAAAITDAGAAAPGVLRGFLLKKRMKKLMQGLSQSSCAFLLEGKRPLQLR